MLRPRALCPKQNTLKCVGKKNPGANQAHQCSNRLDHRKHPLRAPRRQNDVAPRTVKRISEAQNGIEMDRGFCATACAKSEQQPLVGGVECSAREYMCGQQRSVYHRAALPISAVFRLRYPCNLVRGGSHHSGLPVLPREAANRPNRRKWSAKVVIGGEWGFGCQIGSSGQREARPAR